MSNEPSTRAIRNIHSKDAVLAALVQNGYHSSFDIFHKPKWEFVEEMVRSGVLGEEAEAAYERARKNYSVLSHAMVAMNTGYYQQSYRNLALAGDGGAGKGKAYFEDIPNYQEIFGSMDYCECEDCKSVFGPAAYFVDLMRIAKQHVKVEDGVPVRTRRPDLFELKLTCRNTNQTLPYVEIVNDVLKPHAKEYVGLAADDDDVKLFAALDAAMYPIGLPFSQPMSKLSAWLAKYRTNFGEVLQVWGYPRSTVARESLAVPPALFAMLQRRLTSDELRACFGGKTAAEDLPATLRELPAFLKAFDMERSELVEMLTQDLGEDEKASLPQLFVNGDFSGGKYLALISETVTDPQTQKKTVFYYIDNLDVPSLERCYRFLRAKRILGVSFGELDWLVRITKPAPDSDADAGLDAESHADATPTMEDAAMDLPAIWGVVNLAKSLSVDIYTVSALLYDVKDYGANPYKEMVGYRRDEMEQFSKSEVDRILSAALGLHRDDVGRLRAYVGKRKKDYVDAVCRHHLLATMLGLGVEEYLALLRIAFPKPVVVFTTEDVTRLFAIKLQRERGVLMGFFEMDAILNGDPLSSPYVDAGFSLDGFYGKVAFMRKDASEEVKEDGELRENYVLSELSQFWSQSYEDVKEMLALVFRTIDQTMEDWLRMALDDEVGMEDLRETVEEFSKYLLMVRCGLPLALITLSSSYPNAVPSMIDLCALAGFLHTFQDEDERLLELVPSYAKDKSDVGVLGDVMGPSVTLERVDALYPVGERPDNVVAFLSNLCLRLSMQGQLSLDEATLNQALSLGSDETSFEERTRVVDELTRASMDANFHAAIEATVRDALLPLVILHLGAKFVDVTNADKLYKYFLVDVRMDDKTTISPVKEGINAVQLYLQRCRMRLEKGSAIQDVPESWWDWIMDYRMWEANRKIFVYPENYLTPSIRQSKTSLFKAVEGALEQSKITDGYIEEQYVKYLDEYFELTRLKICGAYETTVNALNVLYLFARTKEEPHTYYYCQRVSALAWSEWEKIDAPIDSENITPVFVFNRLHVFWSRVTENPKVEVSGGGTLNADNQRSYALQIKYTYLNLQGKWIAPQSLFSGETIYAEDDKAAPEGANGKGVDEELGMARPGEDFAHLTLMRLTKDNVKGFLTVPEDYERLVVITGGFTHNAGKLLTGPDESDALNGDRERYGRKLARMADNNNSLVRNNETGFFSTGFLRVFDEELEEDKFLHDNEFIVVDGYIPTEHVLTYTTISDAVHRSVGGYFSQSVITDAASPTRGVLPYRNNGGGCAPPTLNDKSFIGGFITEEVSKAIYTDLEGSGIISQGRVNEKALANFDLLSLLGYIFTGDEGSRGKTDVSNLILEVESILLANIGAAYLFTKSGDATVIPVVNQPGKFIYECDNEAFLVYPVYRDKEGNVTPLELQKIDAGVTVGTVITAWTFKQIGFEDVASGEIFRILKAEGNNLINEHNIVSRDACTMEALIHIDDLTHALETYDVANVERNRKMIYVRLMNLPILSKEIFADIGGEPVINVLTGRGILYPHLDDADLYYFDFRAMSQATDIVFVNGEGGLLPPKTVAAIYERLTAAVSSVGFNYRTRPLPEDFPKDCYFKDWQFSVQRLTNPTIKKLKRKLEVGGVSSFLKRETQSPPKPGEEVMPFGRFGPADNVIPPRALDGAQIDFEGLYAEYNWELFYHIPMTIAEAFRVNTMYNPGKDWFHYIFNPTKVPDGALEKYYWNFYPFVPEDSEALEKILTNQSAIQAYNDSPFNPHAIARLRIDAYAKYTVMEYVENIIQWGDSQFVLNTWESLTTATMMYVWAKDLLGPKPVNLGKAKERAPVSFQEIEDKYKKEIPQFIIDLEAKLQERMVLHDFIPQNGDVPYNDVRAYFGVPENRQFLQMWDVVEDRLFKLRHSLDINGSPRVTSLYEPGIDPSSIARAASMAGGGSPKALTRQGPLYPYRFTYMVEQAKILTSELIQLGNGMLSALEKKDAEALMALVNVQELKIITLTTDIKEYFVEEMESGITSLSLSKDSASRRRDFYAKQAEEYMSTKEIVSFAASTVAATLSAIGGTTMFASGIAHLVPQVGSPFAMKYGGVEVGSSLRGAAAGYEVLAGISNHVAMQTGVMANYDRRRDEWNLQKQMAEDEVATLSEQIQAAKIRLDSAKRDLAIHKQTAAHKNEVLEFYKSKFTNGKLYQFLEGKLASSMWQSYQLALELALAAQESYAFERDEDGDFVRYDYWDDARRGLTAGEGLMTALEQMAASYHKKNARRLEIEKNISLKALFPEQFAAFVDADNKAGVLAFDLNERLFAADYPGGYRRKIVAVSLTIPAVLPPYETVKATLKQTASYVLMKPDATGVDYLWDVAGGVTGGVPAPSEDVVKKITRVGAKIAISRGVDDAGAFVLDFNDARYLPFEGTGAGSSWVLEMPKASNAIDFESVSDVILTIRYTALEDDLRGDGSFHEYVCKKLRSGKEEGGCV